MDDDKAGMYVKPPSGSYVSWENTMCNPLGDMRTQTQSAWHDGYASAKAEREYIGLTDEERKEIIRRQKDFWGPVGWELECAKAIEAKLREKNSG